MRFGIDVGGMTVKIGLVEGTTIKDKFAIQTRKNTFFADIADAIKKYMIENKLEFSSLEGIGFGLPGVVKDNKVDFLPNVGIRNIDLVYEMQKYFPKTKIASCNDANAAALGESKIQELHNTVFITLGTGVGGGIIQNGFVLEGCLGAAGEFGHICLDSIHQYPCNCGQKGCLETVCSATGIVRLANEYRKDYPESMLNKIHFAAKDVIDAAKVNDALGLKVFYEVCDYLGRAIANIAVVLNPDSFILGGGVSEAGEFLLSGVTASFQKYAHYAVKNTKIHLAILGNDAGILGAASLL